MWSPKSNIKRTPRKRPRKKRKSQPFYQSRAWRETRAAYLRHYEHRLFMEIPKNKWAIEGAVLDVGPVEKAHILSLGYLPCEICLKLFIVGAYRTIEKGRDVDHIDPVNPDNALDSEGHGSPFDFDNLQLLCRRHHSKKTARESWSG